MIRSISYLRHVNIVSAQKAIAKRIPLSSRPKTLSSRPKGEISNHHRKRRAYIDRFTNILFLLAFICLLIACQDREDRWLGDGLSAQEQEQFNCSNRIKDAKISWRESLTNDPTTCARGECIEMATDAVVDQNGWFYLAQITRDQTGDGISFIAATIDKMKNKSGYGMGSGTPHGVFFETNENPDPAFGEQISYSDYSYLLSIAPSDSTNEDETRFDTVVALNNISTTRTFFRLYKINDYYFDKSVLLTHVEKRNVVSITHDTRGNIVAISCHIEVIDASMPSGDSTDYRVAKYDPSGVLSWERELQGNTLPAPAIAFDSENNILLAHDKTDAIDSALERELRRSFLWLTKLDEAGELIWEREMDGVAEELGLAVDQSDNIILAAANYIYDMEADQRIHIYEPWIGYISHEGVLQEVYTSEGLYDELSLDSEDYVTETLNVQDLVVDRIGRIYIPIAERQTMGADQAMIAEWTPSLHLCSLVDVQDEAPIRLYLSANDELFYSNRYSFGKIDR